MHDQGGCVSCDVVEPALDAADEFIQSAIILVLDYHPVITQWNTLQVTRPETVSFNLHLPTFLSFPPTLRYRVLLI